MIKIKVSGKNIERFIKRLNTHNINIYKLEYLNINSIIITIKKEDYEKCLKLKSIYELEYLDSLGLLKLKYLFYKNKFLIICFLFGIGIMYFLSNIIFSIEIVYNDSKIRNLLLSELRKNGVYPHTFKKSYEELEQIKNNIIKDNRDIIEWLEIETNGTKYIVRVEERKENEELEEIKPRNIIASKDARIIKVDVSNGVIEKHSGQYVKKGDLIVNGTVTLNGNNKNYTAATGKVYGEVWYQVSVSYPLYYYEEKETNLEKKVLVFSFLNRRFELFSSFEHKKIKEISLFSSYLLPIKLSYETQTKIEVIENIYTHEQALEKALEKSRQKIEGNLSQEEYIISEKYLNYSIKDSKIEVDVFYSVCEEIGEYQEIVIEGE